MTKKTNKKQLVISKEVYIHLKDNKGNLAATICLISSNLGVGRGVSVCSAYENFDRKKGRHYAKRFAIRVLKGRPCSFKRQEVLDLLREIPFFLSDAVTPIKKGDLNPILSGLELKVYKGSSSNDKG